MQRCNLGVHWRLGDYNTKILLGWEEMKKIIIAGSRLFNDYELLKKELDNYIAEEKLASKDIEIVSGHCRGADILGEKYAKEHGINVKYFLPDWDTYGRSAGPIRNAAMAEYIKDDGFLFSFWDGESKGSKTMIYEASKRKIPYKIIYYKKGVVFDGCGEAS